MTNSDSERWERIKFLFDLAVDLEADQQEGYVREVAAGDDVLATEVLSLLRYSERTVLHDRLAAPSVLKSIGDDEFDRAMVMPEDWSTQNIGQYRLIQRIGEGGMGTVYRAFDERLNRFVALKAFKRTGAGTLDRFKDEFRKFHHLQHPNLVKLYELVEDNKAGASLWGSSRAARFWIISAGHSRADRIWIRREWNGCASRFNRSRKRLPPYMRISCSTAISNRVIYS